MPIDRSNPLPIHQFSNLIEEVAKLKELEGKSDAKPWIYGVYPDDCDKCEDCEYDPREHKDIDCPNPIKQSWKPIAMIGDGYCVPGIYAPQSSLNSNHNGKLLEGLRNAAPDLLAVLGGFRAGDAAIIGLFVEFMEKHKPDGHLNDTGPGAKITNAKAAACLRRYRDMAQAMEGSQ